MEKPKTKTNQKEKEKEKVMPKTKRKKARIYKRMPKGYKGYDPARSAKQARALLRSAPKDANAIIVKVGPSRGKNKWVFPYHIASNNPMYA
jgi:hypothetical protein